MERNELLDRLALGYNCHRCGASADEPCRTAKGQEVAPHQTRIDRAVEKRAYRLFKQAQAHRRNH